MQHNQTRFGFCLMTACAVGNPFHRNLIVKFKLYTIEI